MTGSTEPLLEWTPSSQMHLWSWCPVSRTWVALNSCPVAQGFLTTNLNESIHSKLWVLCNKHKNHRLERVRFTTKQVILTHNFGCRRASLLNVLGKMTTSMSHDLDILDSESVRVASRKQSLARSSSTVQRKKVKKSESLYQKNREKARGWGQRQGQRQ